MSEPRRTTRPDARRASCWPTPCSKHAAAAVADLTERIEVAEAQAVIIWQGEPIPPPAGAEPGGGHRQPDRAERPVRQPRGGEAINPLREEKLAAGPGGRGLGYADVPAMVAASAGFDPDALAAEMRLFLPSRRPSTSPPCAGSWPRSTSSRATPRGRPRAHHPRRGLGPLVRGAPHAAGLPRDLDGLGIDIDAQPSILLDIEPRPQKSARAFCAAVNVPNDVRLVIQPRGWDDYAALLHEGGHAEHFAHVDPALRARGACSATTA